MLRNVTRELTEAESHEAAGEKMLATKVKSPYSIPRASGAQ